MNTPGSTKEICIKDFYGEIEIKSNNKFSEFSSNVKEISSLSRAPVPNGLTIGSIVNLTGDVGKTTLAFNLAFYLRNTLIIDLDPQGVLTSLLNEQKKPLTVTSYDYIAPYILSNKEKPTPVRYSIEQLSKYFTGTRNILIPSSEQLYDLPSQIYSVLNKIKTFPEREQETLFNYINDSLNLSILDFWKEIDKVNINKCLIDTSAYYPGATKLAIEASNFLIVPMSLTLTALHAFNTLIEILKGIYRKEGRSNYPVFKALVFYSDNPNVDYFKEYMELIKKIVENNPYFFDKAFQVILMYGLKDYSYFMLSKKMPIGSLIDEEPSESAINKAHSAFQKLARSLFS